MAVKVLREPDRVAIRKRFLREGRLLARMRHPNLVYCRHVIDTEAPALILELLQGESLDRRLRRAVLPPAEAERVALDLLGVLGHLHDRGIVHRDVKSSNIFLCDDGRVVLMDLGLAVDPADPLTTTLGDVVGTHAYMAPEQIAGGEVDHRCDLYSLGITLYECVSGRRPYEARGLTGYLAAHRHGGAPPLRTRVPGLARPLAELVERLMARDPAARPGTASSAALLLTGRPPKNRGLFPPPMVGREAVRGAIEGILDGGGVLRVIGEPGSGTGRVVRTALDLAAASQVDRLVLRCRSRTDTHELTIQLARGLRTLGVSAPPLLPDLLEACDALIREKSLLILVEDYQAAAAEVVGSLAKLPGISLLLLGAHLPPEPGGHELTLRPISRAEVGTMIQAMLGTPTLPLGLEDSVLRATAGLPALIPAVLREGLAASHLRFEGLGEDGQPRWSYDSRSFGRPGAEFERRLQESITRMPEEARILLHVLAVADEPLPLDLLLVAAQQDASGASLSPLLSGGLVRIELEEGEEWVTLRSAVLGPAVTRNVDEALQAEYHLALADSARARPRGEWELRFELLHRALATHDQAHFGALTDYAAWLAASGRPLEALATLEPAANIAAPEPRINVAWAVARAEALLGLGRLADARLALHAAGALALEAGDADLLVRLALTQTRLLLAAGAALPEPSAPDADAHAWTWLVTAHVLYRQGQPRRAREALQAAEQRAPPAPGQELSHQIRVLGARLDGDSGKLDAAARTLRALVVEDRALGRPALMAESTCWLAMMLRDQGHYATALGLLTRAESSAQELPAMRGWAAALRASVLIRIGALAEASQILSSNASLGDPGTPYPVRVTWLDSMARLREEEQDHPSTLAAHLRAAEAAASAGDVTRRALHQGLAAIVTADAVGVGHAADDLSRAGIHRHLARLFLSGARIGQDPDLLPVAESEARAAGDQPMLLEVLSALRGAEAREEAKLIVGDMLDGLHHGLRDALLARPSVRWALGGPERRGGA